MLPAWQESWQGLLSGDMTITIYMHQLITNMSCHTAMHSSLIRQYLLGAVLPVHTVDTFCHENTERIVL